MTGIIRVEQVKNTLVSLRGQHVILASDVAKLYGVETKIINQAVKNNPNKFPQGFVY
ncbi:MAG: ORF6N domain-containing protein [Muribaculaceae bacterium]|nr:ORF6N domain-containing protein [Muribaculaceae bacterium]